MKEKFRRVALVLFSLLMTGPLAYSTAETDIPSVFTAEDRDIITRYVLIYLRKNWESDACLVPYFKTESFSQFVYSGHKHLNTEKIPKYLIPPKIKSCKSVDESRSRYIIGQPDFKSYINPTPNLRHVDTAWVSVVFLCDADHVCGQESSLSYSRISNGEWGDEDYQQGSILM